MRSIVFFAILLAFFTGCAKDHTHRAYIISQSQKKEQTASPVEEDDS